LFGSGRSVPVTFARSTRLLPSDYHHETQPSIFSPTPSLYPRERVRASKRESEAEKKKRRNQAAAPKMVRGRRVNNNSGGVFDQREKE